MTRRSRLTRLEAQRPAEPEETPQNFAMRLKQFNYFMAKFGVLPLTPDEFKVWGAEMRRCGGVQAWIAAHRQRPE